MAQMDDLKRQFDSMTQRAHMTASRCLEEQEARSRAELQSFSLQEQNALMRSRNSWLQQQAERGESLRREAESKAGRCENDAQQLKMRMSLFQRIVGPDGERRVEPAADPLTARREAIARERAASLLGKSTLVWKP